jgi:AraC-like DNA-binding protein
MPTAHPRPWRRGSLFTAGLRRPLDRDQRARFRFLLRAHTRVGRLPAKAEWVGNALLKRLGEGGQCDPSQETLASDAGCSSRTVRRATATMDVLGLLRWQTRLVRAGWRTEQTSNAYELVPTGPNPDVCCGGQSVRETKRKIISTGPSEGSDDWGRWNRDRQLSILAGLEPPRKEDC